VSSARPRLPATHRLDDQFASSGKFVNFSEIYTTYCVVWLIFCTSYKRLPVKGGPDGIPKKAGLEEDHQVRCEACRQEGRKEEQVSRAPRLIAKETPRPIAGALFCARDFLVSAPPYENPSTGWGT
jgi:hypothetical protein